ncbi:HEAT repeat-containing protein 6-like [Uloborus diversus]|uniref:HEAT repeat-containing protein 6-like n=1 Tax=Uloborus diversus TaxID=327109 RepID=UPI00240A1DE5|nr:HEAT repeat-containing protein 6-like [Uloborus diversus]
MDAEVAQELILSCHSKLKSAKVTGVIELNHMIDEINALSINDLCLQNQIIEEILCSMGKSIPYGNDHILSKFSSLVHFFIHKHKISLTPSCAAYLTDFTLSALSTCGEWVLNDVLIAFSALLYINCEKNQKVHAALIDESSVFSNLLLLPRQDLSIQYNAFQCLLSLLEKKPNESVLSDEILSACCQKCILVLKQKLETSSSDIISLKIIKSSLKCLQYIFASKNLPLKNFGELLGVLKCTIFYGLPGPCPTDTVLHPTLKCPDPLFSDDLQNESDSAPYPKLRKQKRNRKNRAKKNAHKTKSEGRCNTDSNELANSDFEGSAASVPAFSPQRKFNDFRAKSSSSDSEFSDAESQASKVKSLCTSIRQNAYQSLLAVVKVAEKKLMFGYWSSFFPDSPSFCGIVASQNIFTTILKDPSSQVRFSALTLLIEMLKGSKHFLSFADGRKIGQLSFISLSSALASMIYEFHRCLHLALLAETSSSHRIQILKCYAVLCENVPYTKVKLDILLKLLKDVKSLIYNKDSQIQASCLSILGAIVNSDQIPDVVIDILISADFDLDTISSVTNAKIVSTSTNSSEQEKELPWTFCLCRSNIFKNEPLPLQIESLQFLSSIVGKYFSKIIPFLDVLESIIIFCFDERNEVPIQLYGAKLLDVLGRCINNSSDLGSDTHKTESLNLILKNLWLNISEKSFIRCLTTVNQTLQTVCCDCLSTIPSSIFEELPKKVQVLYITVLLGLAADPNPNLRGSAIRCLGMYCLYPCLIEDFSFLNDVSDKLILSVDDPNKNVRFKASWAFGNLSNALFMNKDNAIIGTEISANFFYSIGMACVKFSRDCDRVKANAVRALGNFVHFIPESFLEDTKMQDFVKSACQSLNLALTSTVMKVCWNTCYAWGNILRNQSLIKHKIINLEEVLNSLLITLKSPNFKVRISAAQALTVLNSRQSYGNLFSSIWLQLISALFSAASDVNFKEIKHQENLCDQLCHSITQLASIISYEDVCEISDRTTDSSEILLTSFWKYGSRTTKEKCEDISFAIEHLTFLKNEKDYEEHLQVLSILLEIFNQAIFAYYGEAES